MSTRKRSRTGSLSPTPVKRLRIPPRSSSAPRAKQGYLEDYVKKLGGYSTYDKKIGRHRYDATFQITNLPTDPEALIGGLFNFCIQEARAETIKNGQNPDEIAISVSSELLNPHMYLRFRPYNENTASVAMNELNRIAQSKQQEGISLWGN
jgi:hypothetical protein